MKYEVRSLEDIAATLEQLADMAEDRKRSATTQREKMRESGISFAYRDSARMLRHTTLMEAT